VPYGQEKAVVLQGLTAGSLATAVVQPELDERWVPSGQQRLVLVEYACTIVTANIEGGVRIGPRPESLVLCVAGLIE